MPVQAGEKMEGNCPAVVEENQAQPENQPFEQPWCMMRHMDERMLDRDGMEFMMNVQTIAIVPFADISCDTGIAASPFASYSGSAGCGRITEFLAAELMHRGYLVIPSSDVQGALSDNSGIVNGMTAAAANNILYRNRSYPEALRFHLESVPGLADQYMLNTQSLPYLTADDIKGLASSVGAQAVMRGFIVERIMDKTVEADLRTLLPPFIGLFAPEQRITLSVSFYLYNGETGELIWNGSSEIRDSSGWDLTSNEASMTRLAEKQAVLNAVGRIVPGWDYLIETHPGWMPPEFWGEGGRWGEGMIDRPDWLNPHRYGWHDEYYQGDWSLNVEPSDTVPYRYQGLLPHYNGIVERTCGMYNDDGDDYDEWDEDDEGDNDDEVDDDDSRCENGRVRVIRERSE
jgi:hypothetical protein